MGSARLPHGTKHLAFGLLLGTAYGVALSGLWRSKDAPIAMSSVTKASHSRATCVSYLYCSPSLALVSFEYVALLAGSECFCQMLHTARGSGRCGAITPDARSCGTIAICRLRGDKSWRPYWLCVFSYSTAELLLSLAVFVPLK